MGIMEHGLEDEEGKELATNQWLPWDKVRVRAWRPRLPVWKRISSVPAQAAATAPGQEEGPLVRFQAVRDPGLPQAMK